MARILDVIEYPDASPNEIVHRVPERGSGDFRIGSQLIVREGQMAVFFRDGKALDTLARAHHHTATSRCCEPGCGACSVATRLYGEVYLQHARLIDRLGTPEPIKHATRCYACRLAPTAL